MANIKFSQFTAEADIANFDDIVGYQGVINKRITPTNLASSLVTLSGGPYLPLVAGNGNPLTGDLYIGEGTAATVNLFFQTTGVAGDVVELLLSESKDDTNVKCLYCKTDHALTRRCDKFRLLQLFDKKKLLFGKKACFLCFETGHQCENCPYKLKHDWKPCKTCQQWHAHTLCPDNVNKVQM